MPTPSDAEIKTYMRNNLEYFVDNACFDVNATLLAEDAAEYFEDYVNDDYDIDEKYFEIAAKIAGDEEEKLHKRWEDYIDMMEL